MPQYVYVNRRYFNTTSLFHAREGLGKRRTGTKQGLYYSSWWYVVCTVMEVICIQKYHRLCAHSMPLCKVRVMVSVMSLICRSHRLQLQQNNFQYFLFLCFQVSWSLRWKTSHGIHQDSRQTEGTTGTSGGFQGEKSSESYWFAFVDHQFSTHTVLKNIWSYTNISNLM